MKGVSVRLPIALLVVCLCLSGCTAFAGHSQTPSRWLNTESEMIEVLGTDLHLRDEGPENAAPILLVHGFGSSLHSWEPMSERLSPDYRLISFDLPGFGLSAPDAQNDYSDQRTHDLILALMRLYELERLAIVGHSLGGRVAWSFAAAHPEKVTSLVLIAPDGYESPMFQYGQPGRTTPLTRLVIYVLPRFIVRWALDVSYGQAPVPADTVDRYYAFLRQRHVKNAILARTRQTILEDPDDILPGIAIPALLIWGEQDRIIPAGNANDFLAALPDSRSAVLPGIGHLPQEEAPSLVARLIVDFFEEHAQE